MQTLDADSLEEISPAEGDEQRNVLCELKIPAHLMITGGEDKEEARLTQADCRSIRQCILDAAQHCADAQRTVLTEDVRDALRDCAGDTGLPEARRNRLQEMAEPWTCFARGWTANCSTTPARPGQKPISPSWTWRPPPMRAHDRVVELPEHAA